MNESSWPRRVVSVVGVLVAAAGVFGTGCGKPLPEGMVRVSGTITYDRSPLPEGTINFARTDGPGSATGRIEPDGRFTVITVPGDYKVAVVSKEGGDRVDEKGSVIVAKRRIPERYESILTSGLEATVTPRGDRLSINLEKTPEKK